MECWGLRIVIFLVRNRCITFLAPAPKNRTFVCKLAPVPLSNICLYLNVVFPDFFTFNPSSINPLHLYHYVFIDIFISIYPAPPAVLASAVSVSSSFDIFLSILFYRYICTDIFISIYFYRIRNDETCFQFMQFLKNPFIRFSLSHHQFFKNRLYIHPTPQHNH